MTTIADALPDHAFAAMLAAWHGLLADLHGQLHEMAAHPARSVVLLPFAQLVPLAQRLWSAQFPQAYVPRFETTRSWAAAVAVEEFGSTDLQFNPGRDALTAAALLDSAGLGVQRDQLAAALLAQATPLGQVAASLPPDQRPAWAAQARAVLPPAGDGPLALEGALAQLALAWANSSSYATDALFSERTGRTLDALVIVPGLQRDVLAESLAQHYVEKLLTLSAPLVEVPGQIALHHCTDGADEAERAAACVLRHLAAGHTPVALVATDRLTARQVSALLSVRGVPLRDETGWKLSTTHAAAQLMAVLRACAPQASTDTVLDALKLAPGVYAEAVRVLEQGLRRDAIRHWVQAETRGTGSLPVNAGLTPQAPMALMTDMRADMAAPRTLHAWLQAARAALQALGLWVPMQQDAAGAALIDALDLSEHALADLADWPPAQRRMGLHAFIRWVSDTLEAATFRPPSTADTADAPVLILPLSQLLGRPLAALVLPGANEQHLPAAPEPVGPWSAAQRQALRLPTRQELQAAQQQAWLSALSVPHVDVLWRSGDDNGQALMPSPLVQPLLGPDRVQPVSLPADTADPREDAALVSVPVAPPAPGGTLVPAVSSLTASAYAALRDCPYRFFAQRLLGHQDDGELDVDLDKRDFGTWLHAALQRFHQALQAEPDADRPALMDAAAHAVAQALALDEAEFLPFTANWPALRDGYLQWLVEHEQTGARFEAAERAAQATLADADLPTPLQLRGRFDRVDRRADGGLDLIDYKTEQPQKTQNRVKAGSGDTQLPFYALLAGERHTSAAYVNISEREGTSSHRPPHLPTLAAQLRAGIVHDMARIAANAPLHPLGEGAVCDWCEMRGLCRKDFWA